MVWHELPSVARALRPVLRTAHPSRVLLKVSDLASSEVTSSDLTINYKPPEVIEVESEVLRNASTRGGQLVRLSGRFFGSVGTVVAAEYASVQGDSGEPLEGSKLIARGCTVVPCWRYCDQLNYGDLQLCHELIEAGALVLARG